MSSPPEETTPVTDVSASPPPASLSPAATQRGSRGSGFIFTTPDSNILLVQDRRSQKWGFCKGHVERSDADTLATAVREANEELGLLPTDYQIASDSFRIADYEFRYAVLIKDPEQFALQEEEIAAVTTISPQSLLVNVREEPDKYNRFVRAWVRTLIHLL